jgi:predicted Zn-dependent protease
MVQAFEAALAHPTPRLQATYGDYAWNVLGDHALGLRMTKEAVQAAPREPVYQVTMIRMLAAQGQRQEAIEALDRLRLLNTGGRLNDQLDELSDRLSLHQGIRITQ